MRAISALCFAAAGLAALSAAGCSRPSGKGNKKGEKTPKVGARPEVPAVRCRLPDAILARMKEVARTAGLSAQVARGWRRLVLAGCRGWPAWARGFIRLHLPPRPEERRALVSEKTIWDRKSFLRVMRGVCPGLDRVLASVDRARNPKEAAERVWRGCQLATKGQPWLHKSDVERSGLAVLPALAIYPSLRRSLPAPVAAVVARLLLVERERLPISLVEKENELMLSRVTEASNRMSYAVDVQLSMVEILVRSRSLKVAIKAGTVDAAAKRDGAKGFLIQPLFTRLEMEHKRQIAATKGRRKSRLLPDPLDIGGAESPRRRGPPRYPVRGRVVLVVHKDLPYRVIAEALYTAQQAGYRRFQLPVHNSKGSIRVLLVDQRPDPCAKKKPTGSGGAAPKTPNPPAGCLRLTLRVVDKGLDLWVKGRSICPGGLCVGYVDGPKLPPGWRPRLHRALRRALKGAPTAPDRRRIALAVRPNAKSEQVMRIIATAHSVTRAGSGKIRCTRRWDRVSGTWRFASPAAQQTCLFHHLRLQLLVP